MNHQKEENKISDTDITQEEADYLELLGVPHIQLSFLKRKAQK